MPSGSIDFVLGLPMSCKQRSKPQHEVRAVRLERDRLLEHGEGVGVHILVAAMLINRLGQPTHLGQAVVDQAGVDQQLEPAARVRREQQLDQLVANPLRADDPSRGAICLDRLEGLEGAP